MEIITREQWGARPPRHRNSITTPTSELWLHHAAGGVVVGDDHVSDADLKRIRAIQNYHMDVRGWSDIAYSFLMDPDGNVFEGRGTGVAGGHTRGHNTVSHAICIMGNYEEQAVDEDLLPRLAALVRHGASEGWWPSKITGGHRDASGAQTSCPGRALHAQISTIHELEEVDTMPEPASWAKESWEAALEAGGVFTEHSDPWDPVTKQEFAVLLQRLGIVEKGPEGRFRIDPDLREDQD